MACVNFIFLKPDVYKNWDKNGKKAILTLCKENLKSISNKEQDVQRIIYEFIHLVLTAKLKADHFVFLVTSLKELSEDTCSIVADVFSVIDIELVALDDKKARDKFISLVSTCKEKVGESLLKERLDVETLESLHLINSTKLFQQKYIKTKTRLFYKQQKFNLLREEMEGYSKLAVELGDLSETRITPLHLLQNIKSLIGCFNIDPNRVLDLILESFESHPQFAKTIFTPLLENYLILCEKSTLCHLLGFKFSHYQNSSKKTPDSLYTVAALLVQYNLVSLEDIWVHLVPENKVLDEEWVKYLKTSADEAKRTTVVSLNPNDKKDEKESKTEIHEASNQKFGLCEALLRVGDWDHAKEIMEKFGFYHMVSSKSIAVALCQLVSHILNPLYNKVAFMKGSKTESNSLSSYFTNSIKVDGYEDLCDEPFEMLFRLGPKTALCPIVVVKLIRISKAFFKMYYSSDQQEKWKKVFGNLLEVICQVVLPSLTLLLCNVNMSEEIWDMMKVLPYQIRYRLYGEWKNESYENHPELLLAKAHVIDKTKYIMRRLTKENVKQTGRQIGKLSHSSPTIVFDCILSQIQRYDNLILPVVDAFKYLTNLTYDVLAFCIIEALANPEKERMKHDDTNISNWLKSLACFCGAIFKKYPIELSGLLQYVANQLKAGKSFDLLIMKEVIQKMSGIEISEEITNDQLDALAGGENLKAEGGYFGQIRNTKKSSNRLKEALVEQNLALPLCLLMAQQRQGIVFHDGEDIHLKLIGKLTDECHDTLVQFGNFLAVQLGIEEYVKRFPTIDILSSLYHTPSDVAFFLSRPMFNHQMNTKYDELRKQDRSKQKSSQDKTQRYILASESVNTPISALVHTMHPDSVWLDISPKFYTTFWTLSLYDIEVPNNAYDRETAKLRQLISGIDQESSHDTRRRREKERCESLISKLKEEQKKQEEHRGRVKARFKNEREGWFLAKTTKNDTITKFLQLCIFPRSIFSPLDAVYCAKFIYILHQLKAPNFSTLLCFDRVFCDISFTVASFTENEASRYGRFLCTMLEIAKKWHGDKATYDKECGNFPGFVTVLRAKHQDGTSQANQLDYENFRHVCHKWQYKLTKALVVCLESKEFTQIRNALMILTKILPHFPAVTALALALEKRIDKIRTEEKDKRPDLFALAMGYSGMLKARKSNLIPEHLFHNKAVPKEKAAAKSASDSGKGKDRGVKRKSEDRKIRASKTNDSSADRGRSKEKSIASGDGKSRHGKSDESIKKERSQSKSRSESLSNTNSEREHKRRKTEQNSKELRVEKKDRESRRKNEKSLERSSLAKDEENLKRKSKERKRELTSSPREVGNINKRSRAENGDRRSKEKKADVRALKETRNDREKKSERVGKSERESRR